MVLSLGDFKFNWDQTNSIALQSEFGISKNERINNNPALFRQSLQSQSITIDGKTLPYKRDKQSGLKKLYELANSGKSHILVTGYGKYLGKFAIMSINENQSIFTDNGLFFTQSFSLELVRDYE
ncbi:phage tail protein [Campylobacter pinnipediorum]|uniref:phage tail protein n=1 Tax=Campylobacter pinnipediorum TaxID=1965231 RepID=UPI00084D4010|nr:phage tail protein [Campylobacter pinnipediorum]